MAKALQRRRGTHEEHKDFVGLEGEFTYDTTEKRIVAHDGVTKGGIPIATKKEVEEVANSLDPRILDAASQADILEAVSQATVGNVDAPTLEGLQAQIAANASNIASKPTPVRYVTETWSSGASWYTKYNDGWIEQGGYVSTLADAIYTVTFPIEFKDTNYHISKNNNWFASTMTTWRHLNFYNKTTTTATTVDTTVNDQGKGFTWEAKGY